jgi:hypothetical protein
MRIHLTPKTGGRRVAGAAVALSALAIGLGLVPAASARTVAQAGPAAAAAPASSTCYWQPTPSAVWVTDTVNKPGIIWSPNYNRPGSRGVAYKVTGPFPHSTTFSFTAYNNLIDIDGPNYVINDSQIIPDPGSVNPFVPGTRVMGTPRNFTAWFWPDSIPVPAGLQNVVLYPTKAEDPGETPGWSLSMRTYKMQPGYTTLAALRAVKITAVSAANPSKPVPCPLFRAGAIASQVARFFKHKQKYGPVPVMPEPKTGNTIYFTKVPAAFFLGLDGYPGPLPQGCASYLVGTIPVRNDISVVTMHQVPTFFNNNLVTAASVMKDYQVRYQSWGINYFTPNLRLYQTLFTNTDEASFQPDGSWVTIFLPRNLSPAQTAQIRSVAKANNFSVLQMPPPPTGPIARQLPYGGITLRQKAISPNFPYTNLNLPCWSQNHNYLTYAQQNSPAFFAKYASSPRNMSNYWVDGVKMTFAQFLAKYSK